MTDIYLPDFKFWTSETSERLCKARDYPQVARRAILEMHRQVGDLVFNEQGIAQRGLLVRHLVMPNQIREGKSILSFLAEEVSTDTYINLMEQYRPTFRVGQGETRARHGFTKYEEIDRPIHDEEMDLLRRHGLEIGLWRFEDNLWIPSPDLM